MDAPTEGRYEGERNDNGEWEGKGVYHFADGTWYEGEFVASMRHGYGTIHYGSGSSYEGQWRNGLKHGTGRSTFADGAEYHGAYVNGFRQGVGTYRLADGQVLVGTFNRDVPDPKYTVWSAGRGEAFEEVGGELVSISLEDAASRAAKLELPVPPVHNERAAELEYLDAHVAKHPASFAARFRVLCYCILISMVFTVALKLTGLMWFLVRSLMSVPLCTRTTIPPPLLPTHHHPPQDVVLSHGARV